MAGEETVRVEAMGTWMLVEEEAKEEDWRRVMSRSTLSRVSTAEEEGCKV